MTTEAQPSRFLTLDEVAQELAITQSQVYALVRSRKLCSVKIGAKGHYRVERVALEEFIRQSYDETEQWLRDNPQTVKGSE